MKKLFLTTMLIACVLNIMAQRDMKVRTIPLDRMVMSDPCILADEATQMYYMTGTSGLLWKSPDLKMWTGPYRVTDTKSVKWMGKHPEIWAAELHKYKGKYYYFATFTNNSIRIDSVRGNVIPRRACHILVSDKPEGPYRPVGKKDYLPATQPTLDGTLWVDKDGHPYMVYCGEWLQNWNGTIEKIRLKDDLSASIGKSKVLFRAYDSPWSREKDDDGTVHPNKVTDGPWLFRTQTGKLGMLWTSWVFGDYTQGVAYSESGTLDGPWIQEKEPITPPNYGHGMLFRTLDGRLMMSVHSHEKKNGHVHRVPHIFPVDDSEDKIKVITEEEKPEKLKAMVPDFKELYKMIATDDYCKSQIAMVLTKLQDNTKEGKPTLFHCTAGKDRAGIISMALLKSYGVDAEQIVKDFMRTNRSAFLPTIKKCIGVWLLTQSLDLVKICYKSFMADRELIKIAIENYKE